MNIKNLKTKGSEINRNMMLLVMGGFLLFFFSCNSNRTLKQTQSFSENEWCADSIIKFVFDVPKSFMGKEFDMYLDIDHTPDIQRNSMTVDITAVSPIDERSASYKIFLKGVDGKFRGTAEGNTLHFSRLLRNKFKFHAVGKWEFQLLQRSDLFYFYGIENLSIVFRENHESIKK
jgi:hypothetical protein